MEMLAAFSARSSVPATRQQLASVRAVRDGMNKLFAYLATRRSRVIILCMLANIVCYVDRTNISIAILPMAEHFGWNDEQQGQILGSFFIGYLLTQILAGELCRIYNGKVVLSVAVIGWSLFTVLTPLASHNVVTLLLVRILLGAFEGMSQPAIHHIISKWTPPSERSQTVAAVSSGAFLGIVLAFLSAPWAARNWQSVFYGFGSLGFVWYIFFELFAAPSPLKDPKITTEEVELLSLKEVPQEDIELDEMDSQQAQLKPIMSSTSVSSLNGSGKLGKDAATPHDNTIWQAMRQAVRNIVVYLREPAFQAIVCAHVANNYGYYVLMSWLPKYLHHLGVDTEQVGSFALIPYAFMFIFDNVWGWFCDRLSNPPRSWPVVRVRKLSQAVAFIAPGLALSILGSGYVTTVEFVTLWMTIGIAGSAASHSGYWANVIDIAPANAGSLLGVSNTLGTVPGVVGNMITGYVLNTTGSWMVVFVIVVALYAVGLMVYLRRAQGHVIFS